LSWQVNYYEFRNIPKLAANQPTLPVWLEPYLNAFWMTSADRINTTNGVGSIPFLSLLAYANWAGIEDQETFIEVLRSVDDEFVDQSNKKIMKKMERETRKYGNIGTT
jgi:hypothetical protein